MGISQQTNKSYRMRALVFLALIAFATAQAATNPFDTCLRSVKADVDKLSRSTEFGLQENWLDMAKLFFEAAADGIQSYEDCNAVQTSDVLMWVDAHTNDHQKTCLSDAAAAYLQIKKAISDCTTHAPQATILADWLEAVTSLNTLAQTCMWE